MLKLYNTLSHTIEEFRPLKKGRVGLYTCGPTVYHFAHIGNLRTYVFEDILKRVFRYNGYKVKHVMNITDVGHLVSDGDTGEDKMEKGAKREGMSAWELAKHYTATFQTDIFELGIEEPTVWCRATDHIKEQIKLIKKLEKKGFTYRTVDGIYFNTSKLPDYGKLANLKNQELKAGARVDVGDKKNITDFALWKFSPAIEQRQMEWPSPWGVGFPGWHIECSAMATKYLGQPFDMHCGGIDHIPVHHTNEIAQSEAAAGAPLANYWLHGEFLLINDDKMAKSGDNFFTLETIKQHKISPIAYRYFLLQAHYRKQLNFSWEALKAAGSGLERLYQSARSLVGKSDASYPLITKEGRGVVAGATSLKDQFLSFINNDLDIAGALGLVWKAINSKSLSLETLLDFDQIFGLQIKEHLAVKKEASLPATIQELITERDNARQKKDWAASDALRQKLEEHGYEVSDTKDGTTVRQTT